jgi:hypothetical protein
MEISASFIRIIISFDEASKYDDGAKLKIMLEQTMNHNM